MIFRYNIYCLKELVLYQYCLIEFVKIYTRMPKKAQSSLSKVRAYEVRYPMKFMATARGELFCTLCSTIVSHDRKFSVDKHRQSTKPHKALSSTSLQRQQLLSIPTASFDWNDFVGKVTAAFLLTILTYRPFLNILVRKLHPSQHAENEFMIWGNVKLIKFAIFFQIKSFSWSLMKLIFQGPKM